MCFYELWICWLSISWLNFHIVACLGLLISFFTLSLTSAQLVQQVLDFLDEIKENLMGDYDPSEVTKSKAIAGSVIFRLTQTSSKYDFNSAISFSTKKWSEGVNSLDVEVFTSESIQSLFLVLLSVRCHHLFCLLQPYVGCPLLEANHH